MIECSKYPVGNCNDLLDQSDMEALHYKKFTIIISDLLSIA